MKTIFEKIICGELPGFKVWEDESFCAFLDISPVNPGHTLLVPKLVVDNVFDMPDDQYVELWLKAKMLSQPIQRATGCKRVAIAVEGFCVPHVHIHLVPVNGGNELNPERACSASNDELAAMQEKILKQFA